MKNVYVVMLKVILVQCWKILSSYSSLLL